MKRILFALCMAALFMQTAGAVEWKAQWIGAPWYTEEYTSDEILPAPEFRKVIESSKKIKNATAYVTGLGLFEFFVNGEKVGDEVLSPNETSYGHRPSLVNFSIPYDDANCRGFRVHYLTYDITKMLHKGSNELSMLLGYGFYAGRNPGMVEPYGTPRLICQVEITYADGTTETVVSDTTWEVRNSPIVMNHMYKGEFYDARLEGTGEWVKAVERKAPDGALMPADGVPDRVVRTIKPVAVKKLDDGNWEVDFDEYVTGWLRLKNFQGEEGQEIVIEFPVETSGNGTYKYTCNGKKVKSYAPKFHYWTYDKAIISGWPGELKASNIVGEVVHTDVKQSATFECSNELFNKINEIWKRSQLDNMHMGVATDCPHREKGPYTGDGEASVVAVMHNFDATAFYRKWFHDMSDCQNLETGYVPNGAPWHPGCGGGVPWGAAMNIMPWEYYVHYGNLDVLEENYIPMKEQVRHMLRWRLEDGTMYQQIVGQDGKPFYWANLGDWCPPYSLPDDQLVHTWYLWRCADFTARAAKALGKMDEAAEYQALADDVAAAFHKKFYNPETGCYGAAEAKAGTGYGVGDHVGTGDGSNIFALAMGVPAERYEKVLACVKNELKENDGHLNTGIFASGLFFEVLCDNGLAEAAYEAMNKRDYPSFGLWIEQGATTTWEQWNGQDSRNHPMFGGALVWLYRKVCGVMTDEAEPGYKHIILKPVPGGDLTWAAYKTETPYGELSVRWDKKSNGKFIYKVKVPAGTHATVCMPDGSDPVEIGPGKKKFTCTL